MDKEKVVKFDLSRKRTKSVSDTPRLTNDIEIDSQQNSIAKDLSPDEIKTFLKVVKYVTSFSMSGIAEIQVIEDELMIKTKNYADYEQYAGFEAGACLEMLGSINMSNEESTVESFQHLLESLIPDQ